MQNNRLRLGAAALASFLACAAGCQLSNLQVNRQAGQMESAGDDVSHLSDRQIANVQLSVARSLEQRGEIDQALNAYREAVDKDPQQPTGYWRMAILQDRRGNAEESDRLFRDALKLAPKDSLILCDYGYSLYLHHRWAEAEGYLRQALTNKSSNRRAHNNLGLLLAQTERPEEALAEFRKAGCQEAEARSNLAFVLTLNRRWNEAREQYEAGLQANPKSAVAKSGLEKLDNLIAKVDAPPDQLLR